MKSLATITENDIDTIKIALNDSISDINNELKDEIKGKKQVELLDYKDKYLKVYNKLRQSPSIYSLSETELDITAGGLNDAIQLLEEILASGELDDREQEETITARDEYSHLVELLAR
jgi:hypothetical protein